MSSPLCAGHVVFHRRAGRLFPHSLAQPVTEDKVTENWSVKGLCPVTVGAGGLVGVRCQNLFFCVCGGSPGKYNSWEQAAGFMAGCPGFVP